MIQQQECSYTVKFSVKYQTKPGQNIYILGSIPELGAWKLNKFKLKWSEGHVWKASLNLSKDIEFFRYKFVCLSDDGKFKRWEEGPDRTFYLKALEKNSTEKYKIDCIWEHFVITFSIYYPLTNDNEYMQIIGKPTALGGWFKDNGVPVKMTLTEPKTLGVISGRFWECKALFPVNDLESFDFDYRYSTYNPIKSMINFNDLDSAVWEREPNRKLTIITDFSFSKENDYEEMTKDATREYEYLINSKVDRLDINFISDLKFNKIGDYPIYIGPYPQNEDDIQVISRAGISAVLNVQTDTDMIHRQINWPHNLKAYEKYNIEIVRYPIRDFDQQDLINKLKDCSEELKRLLDNQKTVYVHCTAGMSRAAATVIAYLVFNESMSLEEAYDFVKSYRHIICPNIGAIAQVIKKETNID